MSDGGGGRCDAIVMSDGGGGGGGGGAKTGQMPSRTGQNHYDQNTGRPGQNGTVGNPRVIQATGVPASPILRTT